jgi:hypothetical protein
MPTRMEWHVSSSLRMVEGPAVRLRQIVDVRIRIRVTVGDHVVGGLWVRAADAVRFKVELVNQSLLRTSEIES